MSARESRDQKLATAGSSSGSASRTLGAPRRQSKSGRVRPPSAAHRPQRRKACARTSRTSAPTQSFRVFAGPKPWPAQGRQARPASPLPTRLQQLSQAHACRSTRPPCCQQPQVAVVCTGRSQRGQRGLHAPRISEWRAAWPRPPWRRRADATRPQVRCAQRRETGTRWEEQVGTGTHRVMSDVRRARSGTGHTLSSRTRVGLRSRHQGSAGDGWWHAARSPSEPAEAKAR